MFKLQIITIAILGILSFTAQADLADDLGDLVGYTIVDSKTIDGWHDEKNKSEDGFEGCEYGRVIVFTDNTTLTCAEYGYQYAYRPTAVILAKKISYGSSSFYSYKMIVEDEIYDMHR